MFLFLPLVLTLYCFCYKSRKNVPVIYLGVLSAVIVCAFKMLFFYSHRIVPYAFGENFVYFLIRESLLPSLILYGLFFLFSKDEMKFKVNAIFPLVLSFYIVFLPYVIFNSPSGYKNPFSLIIKPIVYSLMIVMLGICGKKIYKFSTEKKYLLVVLFAFIAIVFMCAPAALETWYLLTTSYLWIILATVGYGAYPITYLILKALGKIEE